MTDASKPTEADSEKARELLSRYDFDDDLFREALEDGIAQALAESRSASAAVVEAAIRWAAANPPVVRESIDLFKALREAGLVDENGNRLPPHPRSRRMDDELPEPERDPKTGVPFCSDGCRHYDGKRCAILGFRPSNICEPAVTMLVDELASERQAHAETKLALDALRAEMAKPFRGAPDLPDDGPDETEPLL